MNSVLISGIIYVWGGVGRWVVGSNQDHPVVVRSPPCLWRGSDRVTSDRYKLTICPVFCNADIDSGDKNIITSGLAIDFFNVPTIIITGFRNQNILITDHELLEGRILKIRNEGNRKKCSVAETNKTKLLNLRLNYISTL